MSRKPRAAHARLRLPIQPARGRLLHDTGDQDAARIASALGNQESICARHYAHLSPSYIADTIREHAGGLDIVPADATVTPIRAAGG